MTGKKNRTKIIIAAVAAVIVLAAIVAVVFFVSNRKNADKTADSGGVTEQEKEDEEKEDIPAEGETDDLPITDEDPQEILQQGKNEENGASVDISQGLSKNENETQRVTFGIDVSKYQGTIDWAKVAESEIDFVMVRVGYRTMANGEIVADVNARYDMQEAQKYGILVGAYFFSSAVSKEEAEEEADWVADYIAKYKITYPVAYNCEGFENTGSRQYNMTKSQRTDAALAFMDRITQRGYEAMFYAPKSEMDSDAEWEAARISSAYKVWVAQYPSVPYPQTAASSYTGSHAMWQYTNKGTVPGISTSVDVNVAYFSFDKAADAKSDETPDEVGADVEALMKFTAVEEQVTAKEETNLRDKPSQGSDSTVLFVLKNGETATRTGKSDSGWSRLVFNGKTCYAVSNYLTTDLSYKPPQETEDDGIKTKFTSVNEQVTAKEAVNLRLKPSVDDTIAPVVVQIKNGDVVTRTGINTEVGWSRVVYNGQTLYCISSFLMLAE